MRAADDCGSVVRARQNLVHGHVAFSKRHHFRDKPRHTLPAVAAGVYAISESARLMYCGMSGREFTRAVEGGRERYGRTDSSPHLLAMREAG